MKLRIEIELDDVGFDAETAARIAGLVEALAPPPKRTLRLEDLPPATNIAVHRRNGHGGG
jgi:hypothetical protein